MSIYAHTEQGTRPETAAEHRDQAMRLLERAGTDADAANLINAAQVHTFMALLARDEEESERFQQRQEHEEAMQRIPGRRVRPGPGPDTGPRRPGRQVRRVTKNFKEKKKTY